MLLSTKRRFSVSIGLLSLVSSLMANAGLVENKKTSPVIAEPAIQEGILPRKYTTFNYPAETPGGDTLLTGIRRTRANEEIVYISGFYKCPSDACVKAFVYKGHLSGTGIWHVLNYPSSAGVTVKATNLYGPNDGAGHNIQVVGNYTTTQTGDATIGCLYEGPLNGSGGWTSLTPSSTVSDPVLNTIAHSTMGGLVVGNYDTQLDSGRAFIYDIGTKVYYEITKPNAESITAYGIWHNGGNSYTIAGGYSNINSQMVPSVDSGYLVDWNKKTHALTNWRVFNYDNDPSKAIVTHFDGITSDRRNGYYLTGDWLGVSQGPELAFIAHVVGNNAAWAPITFPPDQITSGNSVYRKVVIGVYEKNGVTNGYISQPKR